MPRELPLAISSDLRQRGGRRRAAMGELIDGVALLWLAAAARPDDRGNEEPMLLARRRRRLD